MTHAAQSPMAAMPNPVEYVPARQFVHAAVFLTLGLYVPATHRGHWLASVSAVPVEIVPAGQAVQLPEVPPRAVLYAPAPHA